MEVSVPTQINQPLSLPIDIFKSGWDKFILENLMILKFFDLFLLVNV